MNIRSIDYFQRKDRNLLYLIGAIISLPGIVVSFIYNSTTAYLVYLIFIVCVAMVVFHASMKDRYSFFSVASDNINVQVKCNCQTTQSHTMNISRFEHILPYIEDCYRKLSLFGRFRKDATKTTSAWYGKTFWFKTDKPIICEECHAEISEIGLEYNHLENLRRHHMNEIRISGNFNDTINKIGLEKFLSMGNIIDKISRNGSDMYLLEMESTNRAEGNRIKLLVASSHTGLATIRVPPETRTCKEGAAWSFGIKPSNYDPDVET